MVGIGKTQLIMITNEFKTSFITFSNTDFVKYVFQFPLLLF